MIGSRREEDLLRTTGKVSPRTRTHKVELLPHVASDVASHSPTHPQTRPKSTMGDCKSDHRSFCSTKACATRSSGGGAYSTRTAKTKSPASCSSTLVRPHILPPSGFARG